MNIIPTMVGMRTIANELHRPARRNYPRRKVTLKGINDLYQADLVEMLPYSGVNKGYKYILTMINCLSKFAFAIPLKTKTGAEVAKALEPIFKKHKMSSLQSDGGKEFFNTNVARLTKKYKINHYSTYSDLKASIVERLNRTLKNKMWKEFTAQGSYKWLDLLPQIVKSYNNTKHRTTSMRPRDVRHKHVKNILKRINKPRNQKPNRQTYTIGDTVRISKVKMIFKKGYLPNWSDEIFTIHAIKPTIPVTYILKDSRGQILKGGFYAQEISKSHTGNVFMVERILRRKGNKVLIRWKGHNESHDSWIPAKHIVRADR
jgi:hypothetical protein